MNYLYKISGREVILTEEEHLRVKEGTEKGADIVFLRNDTIGISPKKVNFFQETTLATEKQIEERRNQLKIGQPMESTDKQVNEKVRTIRKIRDEFIKNHPEMFGQFKEKFDDLNDKEMPTIEVPDEITSEQMDEIFG